MAVVYFYANGVAAPLARAKFWEERKHAVERSQNPPASHTPCQQPASPLVAQIMAALAHYGTLRTMFCPAPATAPLVIYLQDSHHQEAIQRNIAALIQRLHERFPDTVVGVEGASGPFDFSPYRMFPDQQLTAAIAEAFLKEELIGGPELAGLTSEHVPRFWGVEDQPIYLANIQAFKRSLALTPQVNTELAHLLAELAHLQGTFQQRPASRAAEQALRQLTHDAALLAKLLDHRLTATEWNQYRRHLRSRLVELPRRLARLTGQPFVSLTSRFAALQNLCPAFEAFYELAEERDRRLADNLLTQEGGGEANPRIAVLVAGGFHTEGILERLRQRGVSYLVVTPTVTRFDSRAPSSLDPLARAPTPLERWFAGESVWLKDPVVVGVTPPPGFEAKAALPQFLEVALHTGSGEYPAHTLNTWADGFPSLRGISPHARTLGSQGSLARLVTLGGHSALVMWGSRGALASVERSSTYRALTGRYHARPLLTVESEGRRGVIAGIPTTQNVLGPDNDEGARRLVEDILNKIRKLRGALANGRRAARKTLTQGALFWLLAPILLTAMALEVYAVIEWTMAPFLMVSHAKSPVTPRHTHRAPGNNPAPQKGSPTSHELDVLRELRQFLQQRSFPLPHWEETDRLPSFFPTKPPATVQAHAALLQQRLVFLEDRALPLYLAFHLVDDTGGPKRFYLLDDHAFQAQLSRGLDHPRSLVNRLHARVAGLRSAAEALNINAIDPARVESMAERQLYAGVELPPATIQHCLSTPAATFQKELDQAMVNAIMSAERPAKAMAPSKANTRGIMPWAGFMRRTLSAPRLTDWQVARLANEVQRGNPPARETFVQANLRLVVSFVSEKMEGNPSYYRDKTGLQFQDVFQEGVLGLQKAVQQFDPDRGTKFSTVAFWWIRNSIAKALQGTGDLVSRPNYVQQTQATVHLAFQNPATPPSLETIASARGWSLDKLHKILTYQHRYVPVKPTMAVSPPIETRLIEQIGAGQLWAKLIGDVTWLTDKEKAVLHWVGELRDPGSDIPFQRIADQMGISRQSVYQLFQAAMYKCLSYVLFTHAPSGVQIRQAYGEHYLTKRRKEVWSRLAPYQQQALRRLCRKTKRNSTNGLLNASIEWDGLLAVLQSLITSPWGIGLSLLLTTVWRMARTPTTRHSQGVREHTLYLQWLTWTLTGQFPEEPFNDHRLHRVIPYMGNLKDLSPSIEDTLNAQHRLASVANAQP